MIKEGAVIISANWLPYEGPDERHVDWRALASIR